MLLHRITRAIDLLTPHRRPLFGFKWPLISHAFFVIYVTMGVGALLQEPIVGGVAFALAGLIEARDVLAKDRLSRKLSGWRRGLEIRSQWRTLLFLVAMVASNASAELTATFVIISLVSTIAIRVIRSRQLQLDTRSRLTPLGSLQRGKERLRKAVAFARSRDLSELPVQAAVGLAALFLALPTASGWTPTPAIVAASVTFAAAVVYVLQLGIRLRRLRPALLTGQHDDEVLAEFLTYDPEVICYFNGHGGSLYAVDVWLRTFEAASKRVALVFRHRDVRHIDTDQLPGIVVPRDAVVEKLIAPSTRVALYPTNGTLNVHLQRDPRLSHVFIGHGDSDKAGSASPATRSYDRIWVSGTAGRERYDAAGLDIAGDRFDIIGRPPLSPRVRAAEKERIEFDAEESPIETLAAAIADGDATGAPRFTILYAPTWEGYFDKSDYSSVEAMAVPLIESILERLPGVRVIFKPHPMQGRRKSSLRDVSATVRDLLEADETTFHPSTIIHSQVSLYDWFDLADVLITDISSVLSDFMMWDRPYFATNPRRFELGDMHAGFPSTQAAYVIDGVDPGLDVLLIENAFSNDPMAERRRRAMERYLGDPDRDPLDMFNEHLDRLWESQPAHHVDDETLVLMGRKQAATVEPRLRETPVAEMPSDDIATGEDEDEDDDSDHSLISEEA